MTKRSLLFVIAIALTCAAAAEPLDEQVLTSVSYLGKSPTQIGLAFEAVTEADDGAVYYERSFDFGTDKVSLNVTAVGGTVVQINWLAAPRGSPGLFEETFRQMNAILPRQGFAVLSQSAALDGHVVVGSQVTHSDCGASFWTSLVNRDLRVRIDMSYIVCRPKACKFSIGIFAGEPDLAVSDCSLAAPQKGTDQQTELIGKEGIEKKAEPGATDNPDDAQRLREDH